MGSGFEPGQEIRLLIAHPDGTTSNIVSQLDPEPVANEFGVWATALTLGRYSRGNLAKPGVFILQVCDASYSFSATVSFGYYTSKKPYREAWLGAGGSEGTKAEEEIARRGSIAGSALPRGYADCRYAPLSRWKKRFYSW